MIEASLTAQLALVGWLPFSVLVFAILRVPQAVIVLMLTPAMFLPEDAVFELQGLPDLDKHTIGVFCVAFNLILRRHAVFVLTRELRAPLAFFTLLVLGATMTAVTNMDVLPDLGSKSLRLYDAVSMAADDVLRIGLPFLLGNAIVRGRRELRSLLVLTAAAGVVYSVFAMYEARMSPQLHYMLYGVHQNEVGKSYRLGGFRPMVFMQTGLALAIFMLTTVLAAVTLMRARLNVMGFRASAVFGYLLVVLVLCRSLGTLVYAALFVPPFVLSTRAFTLAVLGLAGCASSYPVLRALDLLPTEAIVAAAEQANPDRAQSLGFRFQNEDLLIDKALERPLFGWGSHGRNRVYDPDTGRDLTITDGYWIIQFGSRGWVGLLAILGLFFLPVFRACRHVHQISDPVDRVMVMGTAMIIVVRFIDMLPNGWYDVHPIFFAGALNGVVWRMLRDSSLPVLAEPRVAAA